MGIYQIWEFVKIKMFVKNFVVFSVNLGVNSLCKNSNNYTHNYSTYCTISFFTQFIILTLQKGMKNVDSLAGVNGWITEF